MLVKLFLISIVAYIVLAEPRRSKIIFKNGRHRDGFLLHRLKKLHRSSVEVGGHYQRRWFQQKLDHFGSDERTFKQLYTVSDGFYKPGGPAFLIISGESPLIGLHGHSDPDSPADWFSNAQRYGAICFELEHRYYGSSRPFQNTSVENLQWLSSRQAIEDIAYFITQMNNQYGLSSDVKWVTFGGSYAGALSAWARLQHPELIAGALASSGPVQAQVDFREYLEVVQSSLATYSQQCVDNIANATQQLETIIHSSSCCERLTTMFGLCDPLDITNKNDIASLEEYMADFFSGGVQYDDNGMQIAAMCNIMLDNSEPDILQRYANTVRNMLFRTNDGPPCLDYKYSNQIAEMQISSYDKVDQSTRLWVYQTCTEFGYFQGSDSSNQPFGSEFPLSYFLQMCIDVFGPQFDSDFIYKAVAATNEYYGGKDLKATHVVLPNGSIDPWHALGITRTENPLSPAILINGTSHCQDTDSPSPEDGPDQIKARELINSNIAFWLLS